MKPSSIRNTICLETSVIFQQCILPDARRDDEFIDEGSEFPHTLPDTYYQTKKIKLRPKLLSVPNLDLKFATANTPRSLSRVSLPNTLTCYPSVLQFKSTSRLSARTKTSHPHHKANLKAVRAHEP